MCPATDSGRPRPADPADLLPEDSVLSFEEYMAMQRAVGEPTRFRILYHLIEVGDRRPRELTDELDLGSSRLHHHLNALVDVGLVENRKSSAPEQDGLSSYYRATELGRVLLEHGVAELLRKEHEYVERYGGE